MNTRFSPRARNQGYALIMVMLFTAIGAFIMSATMTRTANVSKMNDRQRQYTINISAAEAATEKVIARMIADFRKDGAGGIAVNLATYTNLIPTTAENAFWGNFVFSNAQGRDNGTYVQISSNWTYVPLDSQYYGLMGYAAKYRIISNVRNITGLEQVTVAAQQEVQPAQIPIFQFAIFYNGLLEFTWAAPLTIRGRVHANADIVTGSAWSLTFNSAVTSSGNITKKGWAGYSLGSMSGAITYSGGKSTNVPSMTLPIGTNNTAAAIREIINYPTGTESMYSPMGTNRYYNKAEMVLLVSNSTVTAQFRVPGGFDLSPTSLTYTNTNTVTLPNFLNLTNQFTDLRENKTVKVTQIDIGKYTLWAQTNPAVFAKMGKVGTSNLVPNILYVADYRTPTSTTLPSIRLANGASLPPRGLTVATPNPLYVLGNYNAPNNLNTTNTSNTKPASLISDALTALSPAWRDINSAASLSSREADFMTVNAAIITGVVDSNPTSGSPFSGGAMNLPRLLEDWGSGASTKLTLNTSIVNLFNSVYATNRWQTPGTYYQAPIRDFNFDQNFTDMTKLPPGTPMLSAILRGRWSNPPPNTVNYAGP